MCKLTLLLIKLPENWIISSRLRSALQTVAQKYFPLNEKPFKALHKLFHFLSAAFRCKFTRKHLLGFYVFLITISAPFGASIKFSFVEFISLFSHHSTKKLFHFFFHQKNSKIIQKSFCFLPFAIRTLRLLLGV